MLLKRKLQYQYQGCATRFMHYELILSSLADYNGLIIIACGSAILQVGTVTNILHDYVVKRPMSQKMLRAKGLYDSCFTVLYNKCFVTKVLMDFMIKVQ